MVDWACKTSKKKKPQSNHKEKYMIYVECPSSKECFSFFVFLYLSGGDILVLQNIHGENQERFHGGGLDEKNR